MNWQPPQREKVQEIFRSVSGGYDLANRVLSLGLDQRWRRVLVAEACKQVSPLQSVLDVATGTGDLAMAFRKKLGPKTKIVGADFSASMLGVAATKDATIEWREADALALPFEDASFDLATISFGLRNVIDTDRALQELYRVVRPNGAVIVLEFGNPGSSIVGRAVNRINRLWLKSVGGAITGAGWAYQYLSETSEAFPGASELAARAAQAIPGAQVSTRTLFPGICYLCLIRKK
jgi:demethylmenaquinone methyltransferase/2-methoxy-6-polyprenyl-1,4-benzoquinol methylase